jgi:hypothetical protein
VNRARLILIPLVILCSALMLTWTVWDHERHASQHELRSQFTYALGDAVSRIEQRMASYEQIRRPI